jgi:hypothetical protein
VTPPGPQPKDGQPKDGQPKDGQPQQQPTTPPSDAFAQPPEAGAGGETAMSDPQMIGDFAGIRSLSRVSVPSFQTITIAQPVVTTSTIGSTITTFTTTTFHTVTSSSSNSSSSRTLLVPINSRAGSGIKIGDNESPRPMDRVFFTFNYFDNLHTPGGFNDPTVRSAYTPGQSSNVYRELIGFEKTFADGNASIGMRLPVFQQDGASIGSSGFGDLSIILKYAFINDCDTGNVLSGGMVITAPTGPSIQTVYGNINDVLLQPYIGFLANQDLFYLQGFSAVLIPTESHDATVWFNDIGVGFWAYKADRCTDQLLTAIIPTLELHVTTPLSNRSSTSAISVPDIVTFTGGVHLGLGNHTWLTLGGVTPISGPTPFNFEYAAQLNFRF